MNQAELRCYREGLGLTVKWMASYLGVSERTYKRLEDARPGPHALTLHDDQAAMVDTLWTYTRARVQDEILAQADAIMAATGEEAHPGWVTYRTDEDANADGIEDAPDGPPLPAAWHRAVMLQAQTVLGGRIRYWPEAVELPRTAPQGDAGDTTGPTGDGSLLAAMNADAEGTGVTWTGAG